MNKELIRKYKTEFDHWLRDGKLLHKDELGNWVNSRNIWDLKTERIKSVVINDKYVEFRKAFAEGKTVQEQDYFNKQWRDMKTDDFHDASETLYEGVYRIKPEEPKFKAGDWVVHPDVDVPWRISQNSIDHLDNSELKLWQPKPGKWCWVYDDISDIPVLRKFVYFDNESNVYQEDDLNTSLKYTVEKYDKSGTILYRYIEPFIGVLPSSIEKY